VIPFGFFTVLAFYYLLFGHYKVYNNIDDAWFLSFAYNHINEGIRFDKVYGVYHGGTQYFGVIHAFVYGTLLNLIGWSAANAHLISTSFVGLSALLWFKTLLKLEFSKETAFIFVILFLLLEPVYSTTQNSRPEALNFFLLSLAFYLIVFKYYVVSGFVSLLTVEIHPMGILTFVYTGAFVLAYLHIKRDFKQLLLYAAGCCLGLAVYVYLHFDYLQTLLHTLSSERANGSSNYVLRYYFKTLFYRHIPELLFILAAYIALLKADSNIQKRFILILTLLFLISLMVVNRDNYHYVIYVYPIFILLIAYTFKKIALVYILLLLIPQYAYVVYKYRHYDMNTHLQKIHKIVPENGNLPVVGYSTYWFVYHASKEFYVSNNPIVSKLKHYYLIEDALFYQDDKVKVDLKSCTKQTIGTTQYLHKNIIAYEVVCR
jgi:hypothetical protein